MTSEKARPPTAPAAGQKIHPLAALVADPNEPAFDPEQPLSPERLPLPAFLAGSTEAYRTGRKIPANLGLWWERYGFSFAKSKNRAKSFSFGLETKEWAVSLELMSRRRPNEVDRCLAHADRISAIVGGMTPKGLSFNLKLSSRLITGIGQPHPIENGLQFHTVLGCPYLPGSSIKGAVQAFADEWLAKAETADEEVEFKSAMTRIFGQPRRLKSGQTHEGGETALGSVAFFDAIPVSPVRIVADVITPHVGNYLISPDYDVKKLEIENPTPICFPVVESGAVFRFSLAPTSTALNTLEVSEISSDVNLAGGWLIACLRDIGIGAKTKSGYGRFVEADEQPDL